MRNNTKYDQILDALQGLLASKSNQTISVSEIAQTAGIGKRSIYYYFPSKFHIPYGNNLRGAIHADYQQTDRGIAGLCLYRDI